MALLTSTSKARVREKRIGSATNINIGILSTITTGTSNTASTVNIPGIGLDAVVTISVQTPTAGIMWDAYVSAPSVITIRANNFSSGTVSTTATKAQIQTFRL